MRIALTAPYSLGPMRGNITTVSRISRHLTLTGAETLVLGGDALSREEMAQRLEAFGPSLIHGFHARHCGELSAYLAERFRVPFIVTITGSDLCDPVLRDHPSTARSLEHAAAIVCFSAAEARELAGRFPSVARRIRCVPQGAEVLPDCDGGEFAIPGAAFVVLLPAALRPVKNVDGAIAALGPLWEGDRRYLLVIAGGEIDRDYGAAVRRQLAAAPWARWLGEVPRERMGALYRRADLVLNCSHSEGMSNCLLEAMALGRPVVAADIAGNRSLVRHGDTGWLFGDEESLRMVIAAAATDSRLRGDVAARGRAVIERDFSPVTEAERYLSIYRRLTGTGCRSRQTPARCGTFGGTIVHGKEPIR